MKMVGENSIFKKSGRKNCLDRIILRNMINRRENIFPPVF